jgi:AmmeMemoRadiSam system protein B
VTRAPVAAGLFYPAEARELGLTIDRLLAGAGPRPVSELRGLVVPHAGYVYSGPIAASAFVLLPRLARVVLLGPSHFVPLEGMAASGADAWGTPLGAVPVAADLREIAVAEGAVVDEAPHATDHALEIELPFLQRACPDGLEILPVAVGRTEAGAVAHLIAALDTLVVVSTDLTHYLDDAAAKRVDRATADAVLARDADSIDDRAACGVFALRGFVEHACRTGLEIELLDLRTSADTAGDPDRVVGYGAFAATAGQRGVA